MYKPNLVTYTPFSNSEEAKITKGPSDTIAEWGSKVTLECEVSGEPTPRRHWQKNKITVSLYI